MNDTGLRKNYGGRMIFGDEKLTPLRSVPHCVLTSVILMDNFGSGRLTCGHTVRFASLARPNFVPLLLHKLQIPASRYVQYYSENF
jgi:hypothetical protein